MRDVEVSITALQLRALLDRKDQAATYVLNENGFEPLRVTIRVADFRPQDPAQINLRLPRRKP